MLSPGSWHKHIPKDPAENLRFRQEMMQRCRNDPSAQAAVRQMCRQDILAYVNLFVWQINPKHVGTEVGPFITWPWQEEALKATLWRLFDEQDDMLWEKSREMGATWMALIIADWLCLFHENKRVLCVSHSEQAVERAGDTGTLFAKIKFMHEHLPDWMIRGIQKRKMGFQFPGGSSISGAASTARSGVGDRVAMVLLDEFSKQQAAYEILGQTADTGPRLFIGTHYGIGTCYFDLTQRPDMKKLVLHWSQHPEKNRGMYRYDQERNEIDHVDKQYHYPVGFNYVMDGTPNGGPFPGLRSPWYDRECVRRQSARDVAMHLDINPKGSVSQFFDALMIRTLRNTYCVEPYWEGEIHYEKDTGKFLELIPRKGGNLKLWVHPTYKGAIKPSKYTMGADLATGTGATPSVISGLNVKTGEKILEYANPFISPDDLGPLAVAICWLLKDEDDEGALFAWEQQGPGLKFGKKVIELGYRNVYYRQNDFDLKKSISDTPGWYPAPDNERILLEEYRAALYGHKFINRSRVALEETLDFRYDPNTGNPTHGNRTAMNDPSGARVNHADRVIADGLAWKMAHGRLVSRPAIVEEGPPPGSLAWRRLLTDNAKQEEEAWA